MPEQPAIVRCSTSSTAVHWLARNITTACATVSLTAVSSRQCWSSVCAGRPAGPARWPQGSGPARLFAQAGDGDPEDSSGTDRVEVQFGLADLQAGDGEQPVEG